MAGPLRDVPHSAMVLAWCKVSKSLLQKDNMITQSQIDGLLKNACENGYKEELLAQSDYAIAYDLINGSKDLEKAAIPDIQHLVADWRNRNEELKVPGELSAALVTDRVQMLAPLKSLEGYDAVRIVRWLATSLIEAKLELQLEQCRTETQRKRTLQISDELQAFRSKLSSLLQEEE